MRKAYSTIILFLTILSGACQQRMRVQEVRIPLDLSTRRPIVEIMIGDKGPYKFIFDTGSGTSVIDASLQEEFKFEVVGTDSLKTQGAARLVSQRVSVPDVAFPNIRISKDVEMSVVNLKAMLPIDGVLSGNFFKDQLVTIDYPASTLTVRNGALDKKESNVMEIIENPRVLSCNLTVDGKTVKAHLDTGSPGGFSLPYAMKDQLNFKGEITKGQEIRTPVASYQPWHARLDGTIQIGDIVYENQDLILVEGFEYANLGYAVMQDLRLTVDRKNNLMKIEKPAKELPSEAGGETNEFTGWYGGQVRRVFLEDGQLHLERGQFRLKLELIEDDLYKMVYHMPVNNELPNVRFEREEGGKIKGFTFIYKDGREDFVAKD